MESLKHKLSEAMAAEEKRLDKLSSISDPHKRKALEERYKAERAREQEQIGWYLEDYRQIQAIRANSKNVGDPNYSNQAEDRQPENTAKSTTAPPIKTMDTDRFKLNVLAKEVNSNKELLYRFEKVDQKVHRRNLAPARDTANESKQLDLLLKKRELLQQLVSVHKNELTALGENIPMTQSSRSHYAPSVRSNSSRSSSASWATFATPSTHNNNQQISSRRPYRVPSLPI